MPNRILKESICTSEQIANLSADAEILFYRLIIKADDYGFYFYNPKIISGTCFPLKQFKEKSIEKWITELYEKGLIGYAHGEDGKTYIKLLKWDKHQQTRATKSKFPNMISVDINCNQLQSNVTVFENVNENVFVNDNSTNTLNKFIKPTIDEIKAYCIERNNKVNPEKFFNHYESNGWMVGKVKMKDWKATVRTWEQTDFNNKPSKPQQKKSKHDLANKHNYDFEELEDKWLNKNSEDCEEEFNE